MTADNSKDPAQLRGEDDAASPVPAAPIEAKLAQRLYDLSSRPYRGLKDYWLFKLLSAASGPNSILPLKMADRMRKSAAKRDPARYLSLVENSASPGPQSMAAPPGATLRSDEYQPYDPPPAITPDVRVIAIYLPQFHPFEENDLWWGKGFTEWTNVGKALPVFAGHYQPHCPVHLGYYDLRIASVMEEQAKIAKEYGVGGFAYYFYWFDGRTIMEDPLKAMLANPRVDMPFSLTWANENWTRRWDGQENDILIGQNHSLEDSRALIHHLAAYFRDSRYIRIDNRPVFTVYRPEAIPDIRATTDLWRAEARALGFDGLYLMATETSGRRDPRPLGFDAGVEFPPIGFSAPKDPISLNIPDPSFEGRIHDYRQVVKQALAQPAADYPRFRTAMLSWDNTARKPKRADIFADFSIAEYRKWLSALCHDARHKVGAAEDEKIVYVNAWNEWAEGTHLEPDQRFGFAYLQATYEALCEDNKRSD
ncbi:MAG: glycoside hydrolase family 99-like domain-containing protein [Albidovulum sp.]